LISGAPAIADAFVQLINQYRYPDYIEQAAIVEIRRIKARVEVERLPQGADPKRHLKLGRGSISDVEWLVQLFQLQHAKTYPQIQTPHTLPALEQMEACGLISNSDARVLKEAWVISSSIRSSAMLYLNKRTDVLPVDRAQLEGIARLTGYPRGGASSLEQDYLAATRRGRAVFEKLFFD
jgi:glutamate-ammonia-ligase adenylyltransferase